jgi:hypothetical protein
MAILWTDGDWTNARSVERPKFSQPIAGVATDYLLTQRFRQFGASYTPLALNSAHPDYASFYLVGESERTPLGGDCVEWTRTYAAVPATHNEPESYALNLIGLFSGAAPLFAGLHLAERVRRTELVVSRVQYDYFKTGPAQTYLTAQDVPRTPALKYMKSLYPTPNVGFTGIPVEALGIDTIPTCTDYVTMIANAAANGWSSAVATQTYNPSTGIATMVPITTEGQFAAEDSRIERWQGLIFRRITRYVLAT